MTEPRKAGLRSCPPAPIQMAMQANGDLGKKMEPWQMDQGKSDKKDAADQFDVVVGQEFTLTLASNPTTGYHWVLGAPLDEAIVEVIGSDYKAPQTTLLGVGGQEIWTFKAVGRGETVINLKYVRPWEKDVPPVKTALHKVIVR